MKTLIAAALVLSLGSSLPADAARPSDLPLRSDRQMVQQVYDVVSDADVDAKPIYRGLAAELQADLWTLQMQEFLAAGPNLTVEQHSIVAEALGLLTAGVHLRDHGSIEESARATAAIDHLSARIRASFTRSEAAVFTQLGRYAIQESLTSLAHRAAADLPKDDHDPKPLREIRIDAVRGPIASNADCECSTESDWCYNSPTAPIQSCIARPMQCTRTPAGCGTFWTYGCNGMCQ